MMKVVELPEEELLNAGNYLQDYRDGIEAQGKDDELISVLNFTLKALSVLWVLLYGSDIINVNVTEEEEEDEDDED